MKTFKSIDTAYYQHNGKTLEVIRELKDREEVDIAEVGKMFKVKLSTGEEIEVFEDEIIESQHDKRPILFKLQGENRMNKNLEFQSQEDATAAFLHSVAVVQSQELLVCEECEGVLPVSVFDDAPEHPCHCPNCGGLLVELNME